MDARALLLDLFETAVAAADPLRLLPLHLPPRPTGRVIVIGAGKAAGSMARALEDSWGQDLTGLVVTRYGHGMACAGIAVLEAGHPLPDAAGQDAARRMCDLLRGLTADDTVICLLSGGGSALLTLPPPAVSLAEKQAVNKALLRSGARIDEMNCVRKHLSAVKGGRLAAMAFPARMVTYVISDVPGDAVEVIASGPTVGDPTTSAEALGILDHYNISVSEQLRDWLRSPQSESVKPGDARLARSSVTVIATARQSLDAAAARARALGLNPVCLGDDIEGEAREVAAAQATLALGSGPAVFLSGGETTVTVRGSGRGGRNAEYLLALMIALRGQNHIYALAADTDGIDGSEDNAGAIFGPDSWRRALALGLDPEVMLADNDAYGLFEALGDLVVTGPTRTNVNDFRAILVT
ncbi:glycerate kinase type-2 family protein [Govanella unica]|uniref:Glycerate kinase n=1 Tax=Govanella unica TaxID=2975056 RepID=A0A9X3Z7I5_9PROT|nr:glycerate kinase [Govania unica]MDA5194103.1 glycerate kinase [Govania unica]